VAGLCQKKHDVGKPQYEKCKFGRGTAQTKRPGSSSKNKRQSPPASPCGRSTNLLATRLERRMEAAQSNHTRNKGARCQPLVRGDAVSY